MIYVYELLNETMTKQEIKQMFEDNVVDFVEDTGYIIIGFQMCTDNLIELHYKEVGNMVKITKVDILSWWKERSNECKSAN